MLPLRLDCSTAALTTPQIVLPILKLVELKMHDFSDCTRTGISILTSTADYNDSAKIAYIAYFFCINVMVECFGCYSSFGSL